MRLNETGRTLAAALEQGCRAHADTPVIVASAVRETATTIGAIHEAGVRFAAHLARIGVRSGDVVAVQLPAWCEWMAASVGVTRVGAVLLPVVSIYGAGELGYILRQSAARVLVTPDRFRGVDYRQVVEACGELPTLAAHVVIGDVVPAGAIGWDEMVAPIDPSPTAEVSPDDVALLVYTSGTTAEPKGVQHSSRTILAELASQAQLRDVAAERTLCPWPPGHVAGAYAMIRPMVLGGTLVLMDQWSPAEAARLVAKHRITSGSFTPFHLSGLLEAAEAGGHELSSLSNILVGAAPVPATLIERCAAHGLRTYRCYGSSEMPTVTTGFPDDPLEKRLGSEGRPMPGAEVRFVDDDGRDVTEGEIVVRGPDLFVGYRDAALNAAAMLPDGWFRTGDIGRFDADGFLQITDRKKDIIIRGGENISSREVEELLLRVPGVQDAAVIAAPDAWMGEIVCAFVVTSAAAVPSIKSIGAQFLAAGVARQKTPERLEIVSELPRNATGKVLKHLLRERVRR